MATQSPLAEIDITEVKRASKWRKQRIARRIDKTEKNPVELLSSMCFKSSTKEGEAKVHNY